jgi:hypothetical protein
MAKHLHVFISQPHLVRLNPELESERKRVVINTDCRVRQRKTPAGTYVAEYSRLFTPRAWSTWRKPERAFIAVWPGEVAIASGYQ